MKEEQLIKLLRLHDKYRSYKNKPDADQNDINRYFYEKRLISEITEEQAKLLEPFDMSAKIIIILMELRDPKDINKILPFEEKVNQWLEEKKKVDERKMINKYREGLNNKTKS